MIRGTMRWQSSTCLRPADTTSAYATAAILDFRGRVRYLSAVSSVACALEWNQQNLTVPVFASRDPSMVRRVQKQVPRRCSTSHQQRHYFRSYGRSRSSSSGERTRSRSVPRETRTKRKRAKRGRECGAGPRPAPREKRAQHLMILPSS